MVRSKKAFSINGYHRPIIIFHEVKSNSILEVIILFWPIISRLILVVSKVRSTKGTGS